MFHEAAGSSSLGNDQFCCCRQWGEEERQQKQERETVLVQCDGMFHHELYGSQKPGCVVEICGVGEVQAGLSKDFSSFFNIGSFHAYHNRQ